MTGRKLIAIIDYGIGNIHSIINAFACLGIDTVLTSDDKIIDSSDAIILPGVGAFPDAMKALNNSGLTKQILKSSAEKPLLGICLGMQMLFDSSDELSFTEGLGLIPGKVKKLEAALLYGESSEVRRLYKIPHIGWNALNIVNQKSPILHGISNGDCVYFVHSYKAYAEAEYISANVEYGEYITASAENKNIFGTQFHPEKSGETGLQILKNFYSLIK